MLELKDLTKLYELGGEKIHALDGVNLQIEDGEFLAITGPSGSGKSTLANIIGGLDAPDKGEVMINGVNIASMNDKQLSAYRNQTIGFIFQSFNLQPNLTALENVTIPLIFSRMKPADRKKRGAECLKAVGLEDRLNHRPGQLSGGQRQRVSIARALANSPKIIIADEPTGNLDSKRGEEIMDLLVALNKTGITLIIITHDMTVAHRANMLLEIKDGQVTRGHK